MRVRDYIAIGCISLSLLVCSFILGRATAPKPGGGDMTVDTVKKIIPLYKDFPDPVKTAQVGYIAVPRYVFISDSVDRPIPYAVHDTTTKYVYLPREQKYYVEDEGRLRLWISGYDPRLDRWELDRIETTITETIYPAAKKWGLELFGDFGGTFSSQPLIRARAGFGLRYQPNRWGFDLLGGYEATMVNGKFTPAPFIEGRATLGIFSW